MKIFGFLKQDRESDAQVVFSDDLMMAAQIRKNLEYVCQRNSQLTVSLDDRPMTYKSLFLEVGDYNNFVIIDALIPEHGNMLLKTSSRIRIDYAIEGIMYSFDSKFIETIIGRFSSVKIAFPTFITKIQRRKHFRVSPSIDKPIIVKLTEGFNERAADISEGGLAIYTGLTERELAVGNVFENVMLRLPTANQDIVTKTVVRNLIRGEGEANKKKCGMEFIGIRLKDKDLIASYVIARQREIIQKEDIYFEYRTPLK
jgi:c-di-GMP-binding flagellar brake protein YcgR